MATVAHKSFYAHLRGESGILGQHAGKVLWFSYETGRIVEVTSYAGLVVLAEAGLADTQALQDTLPRGDRLHQAPGGGIDGALLSTQPRTKPGLGGGLLALPGPGRHYL